MPVENSTRSKAELEHQRFLAEIRAHELHIKFIYGVRLGGMLLSAICIISGAIMIYLGLQGSFDWAIQAPTTFSAKLTNASPGIIFATIGLILGYAVLLRRPV